MDMRKSRVLRKIRGGEVAYSFKLNLGDPRVAEIASMSGIDCLWVGWIHSWPVQWYTVLFRDGCQ